MKAVLLLGLITASSFSFADHIYNCTVPKGLGYSSDVIFQFSHKVYPTGGERTYLKFEEHIGQDYDNLTLIKKIEGDNLYLAHGGYNKATLYIENYSLIGEGKTDIGEVSYAYYDGAQRPAFCVLEE